PALGRGAASLPHHGNCARACLSVECAERPPVPAIRLLDRRRPRRAPARYARGHGAGAQDPAGDDPALLYPPCGGTGTKAFPLGAVRQAERGVPEVAVGGCGTVPRHSEPDADGTVPSEVPVDP